ncbi:MAG: flagellar hook-basal body complex protein FliE [Hyphomicrobiales bacterium]
MVATNMQVNNAYMNALNSVSGGDSKASKASEIGGAGDSNFGSMLSDTVNKVVDTGRDADSKMTAQAIGKVDVVDVVTAVAETEVAVQTLVSVRDRVISAYQDILRMPI